MAVKTPFQRHLLAGAKNHNTQCINNITTCINVKRVDMKSIYYLCIWECWPGATLTIVPTKKISGHGNNPRPDYILIQN